MSGASATSFAQINIGLFCTEKYWAFHQMEYFHLDFKKFTNRTEIDNIYRTLVSGIES